MSLRFLLVAVAGASLAAQTGTNLITTIAGTDPTLAAGPALATTLPPGGWGKPAVDAAGNIYFAVPGWNAVLRLTLAGRVERYAGNGLGRYSGDGGPALLASLNGPRDVAVDSSGNVYIADAGNRRVRRVRTDRTIETVAGGGNQTPTASGVGAAQAALPGLETVAVDGAGNVYANIDATSIARVDNGSRTLRLYAGAPGVTGVPVNGPAAQSRFGAIRSLLGDAAGNVYIADAGAVMIARINAAGRLEIFASRNALPGPPVDVTVDSEGNVYFAVEGAGAIWRRQGNGSIGVWAGNTEQEGFSVNGAARERSSFGSELRLGIDIKNALIVSDNRNGKLRKVGTVAEELAGAGLLYTGEGGAATTAVVTGPAYVAQSLTGTTYFSDPGSRLVFAVTPTGVIRRFAGGGTLNASFVDGVPALNGAFGTPYGIAVDLQGNVYVADDDCAVRRIGRDGAMRLYAGRPKVCGTNQEGTAPLSARFGRLRGLAFDATGTLYITDITNHKVWRIGADGMVRTFAGTGQPGAASAGTPAMQAALNTPVGVAAGPDNTVFISESANNRVVRVGTEGRLFPFTGIPRPGGVAVDGNGNLYVAEPEGHRVTVVNRSAISSTYAGAGTAGFRGDGGPAAAALLNGPASVAVNPQGLVVIADRGNGRLRMVLNTAPTVTFPNVNLALAPEAGEYSLGGTVNIPSPLPGLIYETSVSYGGGATGWLTILPPRGTLPASIRYEVSTAGLEPGEYTAQVTVRVPNAAQGEAVFPVRLRVPQQPTRDSLVVRNTRITMLALRGGNKTQSIPVFNRGARPLTVKSSITRGEFLTIEPPEVTIAPGETSSFTLRGASGGLMAGTYLGGAALTAGTETVPVVCSFTVSPRPARLTLSQTGLSFRVVAGGPAALPQAIYGNLAGLAARATTVSGAGWLTATADGSAVTVSVDAQGLAVGDHYGRVEISDATAAAIRQTATVVLQVLPPGSTPGPEIFPTSMIFTTTEGGTVAGQDLRLARRTTGSSNFTVTGATLDGEPWLAFTPAAGQVTSDGTFRITVQPDAAGLRAGEYRGALTISLDDGQTRTAPVLLIVAPQNAPGPLAKERERAGSNCASPNLFPQVIAPAANFRVTVGEPVRLAARVVDGCGNPHQPEGGGTAGVAVTGLGSQVVNLSHIGGGVWEGTVTPPATQANVTFTFLALFSRGTNLQAGADKVSGEVQTAARPVVFAESLTDAASFQFGLPVGPGTLVSLFGTNLNAANNVPTTLPLPSQLGEVEVRLNDQPIPLLYAGPGQINAQIPYNLSGDTEYQLEIRRGQAIATPQPVVIAQARPGIFTVDQTGQGQGHIYRALTGGAQVLADGAGAASAGEVLVIYCNGLGATTPGVTAGAAAPFSPLAVTSNEVALTIGGVPATVAFAGLAPGFTGLYQINAVMPAGVAAGASVPVVITVAGQESVPVTMGAR